MPAAAGGPGVSDLPPPLSVLFHRGFRFGSRTEGRNGGKQREGPPTRSQEPRSPWQR